MLSVASRLACRRLRQIGGNTPWVASWYKSPNRPTLTVTRQQPMATLAIDLGPSMSSALVCPTRNNMTSNIIRRIEALASELSSQWIWLIKRTFQPSIIRKKRKMGCLKRRKTVGGRRILKRRKAKGRARLFGA